MTTISRDPDLPFDPDNARAAFHRRSLSLATATSHLRDANQAWASPTLFVPPPHSPLSQLPPLLEICGNDAAAVDGADATRRKDAAGEQTAVDAALPEAVGGRTNGYLRGDEASRRPLGRTRSQAIGPTHQAPRANLLASPSQRYDSSSFSGSLKERTSEHAARIRNMMQKERLDFLEPPSNAQPATVKDDPRALAEGLPLNSPQLPQQQNANGEMSAQATVSPGGHRRGGSNQLGGLQAHLPHLLAATTLSRRGSITSSHARDSSYGSGISFSGSSGSSASGVSGASGISGRTSNAGVPAFSPNAVAVGSVTVAPASFSPQFANPFSTDGQTPSLGSVAPVRVAPVELELPGSPASSASPAWSPSPISPPEGGFIPTIRRAISLAVQRAKPQQQLQQQLLVQAHPVLAIPTRNGTAAALAADPPTVEFSPSSCAVALGHASAQPKTAAALCPKCGHTMAPAASSPDEGRESAQGRKGRRRVPAAAVEAAAAAAKAAQAAAMAAEAAAAAAKEAASAAAAAAAAIAEEMDSDCWESDCMGEEAGKGGTGGVGCDTVACVQAAVGSGARGGEDKRAESVACREGGAMGAEGGGRAAEEGAETASAEAEDGAGQGVRGDSEAATAGQGEMCTGETETRAGEETGAAAAGRGQKAQGKYKRLSPRPVVVERRGFSDARAIQSPPSAAATMGNEEGGPESGRARGGMGQQSPRGRKGRERGIDGAEESRGTWVGPGAMNGEDATDSSEGADEMAAGDTGGHEGWEQTEQKGQGEQRAPFPSPPPHAEPRLRAAPPAARPLDASSPRAHSPRRLSPSARSPRATSSPKAVSPRAGAGTRADTRAGGQSGTGSSGSEGEEYHTPHSTPPPPSDSLPSALHHAQQLAGLPLSPSLEAYLVDARADHAADGSCAEPPEAHDTGESSVECGEQYGAEGGEDIPLIDDGPVAAPSRPPKSPRPERALSPLAARGARQPRARQAPARSPRSPRTRAVKDGAWRCKSMQEGSSNPSSAASASRAGGSSAAAASTARPAARTRSFREQSPRGTLRSAGGGGRVLRKAGSEPEERGGVGEGVGGSRAGRGARGGQVWSQARPRSPREAPRSPRARSKSPTDGLRSPSEGLRSPRAAGRSPRPLPSPNAGLPGRDVGAGERGAGGRSRQARKVSSWSGPGGGEGGGGGEGDAEEAGRRTGAESRAGGGGGRGVGQGGLGQGGSASFSAAGGARVAEFILGRAYRDVGEAYEVGGEQLGVGQFGVIRACVSRSTGQVMACKAISKERILAQEDAEDVAKEVRVMQQLRGHPHIVKIHRAMEDSQHVHIIMEICRGGDLFDRVKAGGRLSERSAAAITERLVEALLWCHEKGVVHRDVKLENILLKQRGHDTDIRLTDFGMAAEVRPGEVLTELIGTPYYMAPEVLAGSYGPEADIWSAGVVLYILLCSLPPFYAASNEGIFDAIRTKDVQFKAPKWHGVSGAAKQLISSMLEKNPRERITGEEVLGAFNGG
ncbi:unnamed protein product [Closterium sp. Naga37s-1]|nr:unnamed protein product [Closterium sp. Naga37s-1]